MKTNQLMKREFNGTQITQRTKDSFFNATELLSVFNQTSNTKKVFAEFWSNQTTKKIYDDLLIKLNVNTLHESIRGKYGATYMHEELLIVFYNWLNKIPNHSFTRDEIIFIQSIMLAFEGVLTFTKQYKFDTYYVDLYIHELNLCIEFDESHHQSQKEKDIKRQEYIESKFNVTFIRHEIKDNYAITINKILLLWKNTLKK
jgi:very-short-patch-repair endonuclease